MMKGYDIPEINPPPVDPTSPPAQNSIHLLLLLGARNGVVGTAEGAVRLGELLCELCYDAEELALQKPLTATLDGTVWRIKGSRNEELRPNELGPFRLSFWCYDGRVLDIGVPLILPTPQRLAQMPRPEPSGQ